MGGYFRRKAKEEAGGNSPTAFFLPFALDSQHQQLLTGLVARKEKGGRRNGSDKTSKGEPDEMIFTRMQGNSNFYPPPKISFAMHN